MATTEISDLCFQNDFDSLMWADFSTFILESKLIRLNLKSNFLSGLQNVIYFIFDNNSGVQKSKYKLRKAMGVVK